MLKPAQLSLFLFCSLTTFTYFISFPSYLSASESLDNLCPDGRIKGEFIVEYKKSGFARSSNLRKTSLRSKLAGYPVTIKRHYTDIYNAEIAHVKTKPDQDDSVVYFDLQQDSLIQSVIPNCKRKKMSPSRYVF